MSVTFTIGGEIKFAPGQIIEADGISPTTPGSNLVLEGGASGGQVVVMKNDSGITISPEGAASTMLTIKSVQTSNATASFPNIVGAAEIVMTTGNQTIPGDKHFTGTVEIDTLSIANISTPGQLASTSTGLQLRMGSTILTAPGTTARLLTVPDPGSNTEFVMAAGPQVISGAKTYTGTVVIDGTLVLNGTADVDNWTVDGQLTSTATIEQLQLGSTVITAPGIVARTLTIPDPGANAEFVFTSGDRSLGGTTTMTAAAVSGTLAVDTIAPQSGTTVTVAGVDVVDVELRLGSAETTIGTNTSAISTLNTTTVKLSGNQVIADNKAFSGRLVINRPSFTGLAYPFGIGAQAPDVDNRAGVLTIMPTAGNNWNVMLTGAESDLTIYRSNVGWNAFRFVSQSGIGGAFYAATSVTAPNIIATTALTAPAFTTTGALAGASLTASATTDQLVLGSTTVTAPGTTARTLTVPDVGAAASFVLTAGAQTIADVKTFTSAVNAASLSWGTSTPTMIGSGTNIFRIYDSAGTTLSNRMLEISSNNKLWTWRADSQLGFVRPGESASAGSVSISVPLAGLVSAQTVTILPVTSTLVNDTSDQTVGGLKTFSSKVIVQGTATSGRSDIFTLKNSSGVNQWLVTVADTTNVLQIGKAGSGYSTFQMFDSGTFESAHLRASGPNGIGWGTPGVGSRLTAPTTGALRTYILPNLGAGVSADVIMSAGDQTIADTKTFTGKIVVTTTDSADPIFRATSMGSVAMWLESDTNYNSGGQQPIFHFSHGNRGYTQLGLDATSGRNFHISAHNSTEATLNAAILFRTGGIIDHTAAVPGTLPTVTTQPVTRMRIHHDGSVRMVGQTAINVNETTTINNYALTVQGTSAATRSNLMALRQASGAQHWTVSLDPTFNLQWGADAAVDTATLYKDGTFEANRIRALASVDLSTGTRIVGPTTGTQRIYTIPDAGAAANFVMSEGTKTIAGSTTFSSNVSVENTLYVGSASTTNFPIYLIGGGTDPDPDSPLINIYDHSSTRRFDMTYSSFYDALMIGSDTLSRRDVYRFHSGGEFQSAGVRLYGATPAGLYFGNESVGTRITAPATGAPVREYVVPDVGDAASFAMTAGDQAIAGQKTYSGLGTFTSGATVKDSTLGIIAGVADPLVNNSQIRISADELNGSGTISFGAGMGPTGTISSLGSVFQIQSSETAPIVFKQGLNTVATIDSLRLNVTAPATSTTFALGIKGGQSSATRSYVADISSYHSESTNPDYRLWHMTMNHTDDTFAIGIANRSFDTFQFHRGTTTSNAIMSAPILNARNTGVTFGDPAAPSTRITAPTTGSMRAYIVPDVGTSASFVMTAGAQTVAGNKSFTNRASFPQGSMVPSAHMKCVGSTTVPNSGIATTLKCTTIDPPSFAYQASIPASAPGTDIAITISIAGFYQVSAAVPVVNADSTGQRSLYLTVNSDIVTISRVSAHAGNMYLNVSALMYLTAGDVISLQGQQTSGGNATYGTSFGTISQQYHFVYFSAVMVTRP